MKWYIIIITVTVIAFYSCHSKQEYKPLEQSDSRVNYYATPSTSSTSHDDDKYEDGYENGQAAAEEDRFAGHPGMQSGDDDEDDDDNYEEGYDDGYEDL